MRKILQKFPEIKSVLNLAVPIAFMQVGMVFYSTVDIIFVAKLGATAVAGLGLGAAIYSMFLLLGIGMLLGVDTLSSQAFGAGKTNHCGVILFHAWVLAFITAIPLVWVLGYSQYFFAWFKVKPEVAVIATKYVLILRWAIFPSLLFAASRQYLQSVNVTRPLVIAIIAGNLLNALLNYIFIFGHFGFPKLGVLGCAYASVTSFTLGFFYILSIVLVQLFYNRFAFTGWDYKLFGKLISLGVPAGLQTFTEVGMFSIVTALAGRLGANDLAAHQIVLNLASITFMVPLGLSFAAAVRVGQGVGEENFTKAIRCGNISLLLAMLFMGTAACIFCLFPKTMLNIYSSEVSLVSIAIPLIYIAAIFQISDGMQIVLTGNLRGLGETKIPFYANLVGHWCMGLPVGYILTFWYDWGVKGLWVGLCVGLIVVAIFLWITWYKRSKKLVIEFL